jgi:hypothetical protein
MSLMSNPYVTKVTFKDGQIVLTVQLDESLANESVEISGYATQDGGGFATFYDIQNTKENPDGSVVIYVKAAPSQNFMNGQPVTVTLRASRVWVTVLAESQDGPERPYYPAITSDGTTARDGTTWGELAAVGSVSPLSSSRVGKTSAGSDSNFRGK